MTGNSSRFILTVSKLFFLLGVALLSLQAHGASSCSLPEALPVKKADPYKGYYEISTTTNLCKGATYNNPFVIMTGNLTLNCQGAVIDGSRQKKNDSGIVLYPFNDISVVDCTVQNFKGNGIGMHMAKTVTTHDGMRLYDYSQYDPKDPKSPFQPMDNITLLRFKSLRNGRDGAGGGGLIRMKNSKIIDSEFRGNFLGFYLEADSFAVRIENSIFADSFGREGLILDGAYSNKIIRNQITNNRQHGLALYKNCGELGGPWLRLTGSNDNLIEGNLISGHTKAIRSVNSITRSAGVAIGSREGLTFFDPVSRNYNRCMDRRTHLYPWTRMTKEVFEAAISGIHKISAADGDFRNTWYLGPHADHAERNVLRNNVIWGNDIGVYVTAKDTVLDRNRFFHQYIDPRANLMDIYFGSIFRDKIRKPVLGLTMMNNRFDWRHAPTLSVSGDPSLRGIVRSGTEEYGQFRINPVGP